MVQERFNLYRQQTILGAFTLITSICRVKRKEGSSLFRMRGYYAYAAASTEIVQLFKHARLLEACRARRSSSRAVFWELRRVSGAPVWNSNCTKEFPSSQSCSARRAIHHFPVPRCALYFLFSVGILRSVSTFHRRSHSTVSSVHNTCIIVNLTAVFFTLRKFSYLIRSYMDLQCLKNRFLICEYSCYFWFSTIKCLFILLT